MIERINEVSGYADFLEGSVNAAPGEQLEAIGTAYARLNERYYQSGMRTADAIQLRMFLYALLVNHDTSNKQSNDPYVQEGGIPVRAALDALNETDTNAAIYEGLTSTYPNSRLHLVLPFSVDGTVPLHVLENTGDTLKGNEQSPTTLAGRAAAAGVNNNFRMSIVSTYLSFVAGRSALGVFALHKNWLDTGSRRVSIPFQSDISLEAQTTFFLKQLDNNSSLGRKLGAFQLLGVRDRLSNIGLEKYRAYEQELRSTETLPFQLVRACVLASLSSFTEKNNELTNELANLGNLAKTLPDNLKVSNKGVRAELLAQLAKPDAERIAIYYVALFGYRPNLYTGPIRVRPEYTDEFINEKNKEKRMVLARKIALTWLEKMGKDRR